MTEPSSERLIRLVDDLEDRASSVVTLEEVESAFGSSVAEFVRANVLLVDYRKRLDGSPVTLCRLNRRHPEVIRLTSW